MPDLTEKISEKSELEDMNQALSEESQVTTELKKTCADCGTSKTPLWRSGPAGPKSLCNACGIRSRKKRRALLGLNKEDRKSSAKSTAATNRVVVGGGGDEEKMMATRKLIGFGMGSSSVLKMQRSKLKMKRKLGEEEQAAVLLMYLSCGSVYA